MSNNSPEILPVMRITSPLHAKEKLALIEKAQAGRDWLATVSASNAEEYHALQALQESLDSKHYDTYFDKDIKGNDALRIRYIGLDSTVSDAVQRTGIMGGAAKIGDTIQHNVAAVGSMMQKTFDKPIKILSGLYILSDLSMVASGIHTSSQSHDSGAVGFLKGFSAVMSGVQSSIFLRYGQDASVRHLGVLQDDVEAMVVAGKQPYDALMQDPEIKKTRNMIDHAERYFIDHPVKMGAAAWIIGQLGLAVAGGIQIHQSKGQDTQHGMENIQRAALSIAGWLMLTVDEKHTEEKTAWNKNPMARVIEEFRESPEKIASAFMMGASVYGLKAAKHDSDPYQALAEVSALTGDVAMFFVRKTEYGADSSGNSLAAAEAAAQFLQDAPMLFTASKETQMVHQLAEYLAVRSVNEKLDYRGQPNFDNDARLEAIEDLKESMKKAIFSQIAGAEKRINEVAHDIASVANFFPDAMQADIKQELVSAITGMRGVYADGQELLQLVEMEHAKFKHASETPLSPPPISVIADKLAELTLTLPTMDAGNNAKALFEVAERYVQSSPAQDTIFNQSLKREHAGKLGVDVARLTQLQAVQQERAYNSV
jgi:hypothetical protein